MHENFFYIKQTKFSIENIKVACGIEIKKFYFFFKKFDNKIIRFLERTHTYIDTYIYIYIYIYIAKNSKFNIFLRVLRFC